MKKKLVLALFAAVAVLSINFVADIFGDYNSNNYNSKISARAINADYEIEIEKEDIMKIHKKYNTSVSDIYNKYQLDFKNLNESTEDSNFISRIVCMDVENYENIENTWFGIVYDENNNPKEIGFYLDGDFESYLNSDGEFSIKDTLIEDIGNLFFARSKFKSDIETFFNDGSSEPGLNSAKFIYKKGIVTATINANKISLKINLNK